MIIAVDFDGTLCRNAYPAIGAPQPGAVKAMQELRDNGHYLIIWTCRTGEHLLEAVNWLAENQIPYHRINDHCPENVAKYGDCGKKVYADVYIDDRNLGGFVGWPMAMNIIMGRANP